MIQRFGFYGDAGMLRNSKGEYILYDDHASVITERDKLIDSLLKYVDNDRYEYFKSRAEAMRGGSYGTKRTNKGRRVY
jgi:hypothetical protein